MNVSYTFNQAEYKVITQNISVLLHEIRDLRIRSTPPTGNELKSFEGSLQLVHNILIGQRKLEEER